MSLLTILGIRQAIKPKTVDAISYERLVIDTAVRIYAANAGTFSYAESWMLASGLIAAMPIEFNAGIQ